jgi:hypothetical protein
MLGKVPNCGSGNFDIVIDEEHLMELLKTTKKQIKENKYNLDDVDEIDNEDEDDEDNDNQCLEENLKFNIDINKKKDDCYKMTKQTIVIK